MPSNVIIFDAAYIAEMTSGMNMACMLVNEAVNFLKRASLHEGWQCKECVTISDNLDDLNVRLGRLDKGVNETTRILGGSVERFAELERKYQAQAENLSDELRNNYGFAASGYTPGNSGGTDMLEGGGTVSGGGTAVIGGSTAVITPGRPAPSSPSNPSAHAAPSSPSAPASPSEPLSPAASNPGQPGQPGVPGSRVAGRSVNVRVNVPGMQGRNTQNPGGIPANAPSLSGTPSGGSINIPVTHIPERPGSVAMGIKAVREIENVAAAGVVQSIAGILGGGVDIASLTPEQQEEITQSIIQVYSVGKSVAENSAAIIADPSQPHTQERIAMASGIVTLAGGITGSGGSVPAAEVISGGQIPVIEGASRVSVRSVDTPQPNAQVRTDTHTASPSPSAHEGTVTAGTQPETTSQPSSQGRTETYTSPSPSAHEGTPTVRTAAIATNAEEVLQNIGNEEGTEEVREVLQAFTSKGGSSGSRSGSSGNRFLETIKSSIIGRVHDDISFGIFGSLSLQEFLSKVL